MNRGAELVGGQVVLVVAEGTLDLDADFLDAEQQKRHHQDGQHRVPVQVVDQCKRQRITVHQERPAEMDDIRERYRGLPNPLAAANAIHKLLHVLVEVDQNDVGNQPTAPGLHQQRADSLSDVRRAVLSLKNRLHVVRCEFTHGGAEVGLATEGVGGDPGEEARPASEIVQEPRMSGQVHAGGADEVAALIDNAAPEPAAFPVAIVGGVRAEHQEQAERHAHQAVQRRGNRGNVPALVQPDDESGPEHTGAQPRPDLLDG